MANTQNIPYFLKKFFWDTDPNTLNVEADKYYIITRILEGGDQKSIKWLFKTYSRDAIKNIVKGEPRVLSEKTKIFWRNVLLK